MAAQLELLSQGDCLTLTLNNPGKRNAVDLALWQRLAAVFAEIAEDAALRCVVIRGAGEVFAAGGDLEEFLTVRATLEQALAYHDDAVAAALRGIRDCPVPTVAQIRGPCVGGGLEIAACCDLRLASDDSVFGAPINRLGFSMYPGEMAVLLERVPAALLAEILLEGRLLNAAEALTKGLVTRVVPVAELESEVEATVGRIRGGAPLVARWHKQWLRRLQSGVPLTAAEKAESFAFLATEDYREGMAAFLEKRRPNFLAK